MKIYIHHSEHGKLCKNIHHIDHGKLRGTVRQLNMENYISKNIFQAFNMEIYISKNIYHISLCMDPLEHRTARFLNNDFPCYNYVF